MDGRRNGNALDPDEDEEGPLDPTTAALAEEIASAPVAGSIEVAIESLAADDPEIERRADGLRSEFAVMGVVFAFTEPGVAGFRLRPEIAAAALRTADTRVSERGSAWVVFRPSTFDRFALDRATSWFELARRLADEGPGGR